MNKVLPRLALADLNNRLEAMPVVVVGGARQSGKTTLVRDLIEDERQFFSLDDPDILELAHRQPMSLLQGSQPITIDEVQKCPNLLPVIKQVVDRKKQSGQFLLTGSANLLLAQTVNESLTGRASYINLRSMTRLEQLGLKKAGIWDKFLDSPTKDWLKLVNQKPHKPKTDLFTIIEKGGLPAVALTNQSPKQRRNWFADYCQTYIERDLKDLSGITQTVSLRRLMKLMATRVGQTVNQAGLSRQLGIAQTTVNRYLNLLEASYWFISLPAYSPNRGRRLIKSPKIYWNDTGLAAYLGEPDQIPGGYLENLVLNDLVIWAENYNRLISPAAIYYWRTTNGREIDFIIETGSQLLPIEVKLTKNPQFSDCRHLLDFQNEFPNKVKSSLLIHTGELTDWIAPTVLATPWWKVF